MRIGIVTSMASVPWGGSEELWYKTAKEAIRNEIDVCFSIYEWRKPPAKVLELEELGANAVRRHRINLGTSITQRSLGKINERIWGLSDLKKILRYKPDVLLFSQGIVYEVLTPSFQKFIESLEIPYFILTQGNIEFGKLPISNLDSAQRIFKNAVKTIFVASRNIEVAERQFAMRHENSVVISNPPNIDKFEILPFPSENGIIDCAYVGRLDAVGKGLAVMCQILSSPKWKERPIRVRLYGEGQDREYLERLISFYNISELVSLEGSASKIERVWENNECLLLPTITEGTPLSLLEAMACGRTAVATDVGGIGDLIVDNCNGFLAKGPSVKLFDEAMERMWEKRADLIELGKRAFNDVCNKVDKHPEKTLLGYLIQGINQSNAN